jgi:hypothetical protein
MFDPKATLRVLCQKAQEIVDESDAFMYAIKADIAPIREKIVKISSEIDKPQIVTIAILGEAGAGKSTLINTLLGEQYLPWSNSNVCTAAVTRVKYSPQSDYRITITYESAETWNKELFGIKQELEAANSSLEEEGIAISRKKLLEPESKDQRAKLKALYGAEAYKSFLATLDISALKPGPNLQNILSEGQSQHVISDRSEVMPFLKKYLIRNGDIDEYWPLVVDVLIEGPFEVLKNGCELVDLPGVADSNQARAKKTINYIDSAKFIFVAYEAKRPPSEVIQEIFRSSRLIKDRLLLDAKESALTFIATKSDDFGIDDPSFQNIGSDPTLWQKCQFVTSQRRNALQEELADFAESVAERVTDDRNAGQIIDAITSSTSFFVSSSEFTKMKGESISASGSNKYLTLEDTGIPMVAAHIDALTLEEGPKAHYRYLWNELLSVDDDLRLIYNGEYVKFVGEGILESERIQKLKRQIAIFTSELNSATSEALFESRDQLKKSINSFFLSTNVDQKAINRVLGSYSSYLQDLNWATLRATAVRGGWFLNSKGKEVDLVQGAANPIIDRFLGPWVDLFSIKLLDILQYLELRLDGLSDKYVSLIRVAQQDVSDQVLFIAGLDNLLDSVENVLAKDISELKRAIKDEIEKRRQTLINLIIESVAKVLEPAIDKAAEERGPGMKARMINLIIDGAGNFAPETYTQVINEISEAVKNTSDRIEELFDLIPQVTDQRSAAITRYFDNLTKKPTPVEEADFEVFGAKVSEYTKFIIDNGSEFAKAVSVREPDAIKLAKREELFKSRFANPNAPYIAVDGSNVASVYLGEKQKVVSLEMLISCIDALKQKYPESNIEIFVDANFRHLLQTDEEKRIYKRMAISREITEGPSGVRADDIFLQAAHLLNGKVVSLDRFKEERSKYPFVDEGNRIITHTRLANGKWVFEERKPKIRDFPRALRSTRSAPSSKSANDLVSMYCVRCKEKRIAEASIKTSDLGGRMAEGMCPVCGTKMNRILGKE